jgi:hypothetical protein
MLVEKIWGKNRSVQRFESALHNYEQFKFLQDNPRWAKKLGAAEATTKLHKAEGGSMFHGPLFFGSQQVEFDVIYDTGSDWVTIEGKNCTNCKGDTYDSTQSSESKQVGKSVSARQYGSALLLGTEFTDKVCLNKFTSCVDDF